jgi:phytoene dehydrogenase-like protein
MTSTSRPIVIVGGGIAGLVSAAIAGKAGHPVVLVEKAAAIGGRAVTRRKNGFLFNLGPHALYRHGLLKQTLRQLGVDPRGGIPTANGGFAVAGGRAHTLPVGFTSLLTSSRRRASSPRLIQRFPLRCSTYKRKTL